MNNSLTELYLRNCGITSRGCTRLLEALGVCLKLRFLSLSHNPIGGAFSVLTSKPFYPKLNCLLLDEMSLKPGDIETINSLLRDKRMPELHELYLSYDNLENIELKTWETLESLNSIIHNVEQISFWKGDSLQDLNKIQETITAGIVKHKSKKNNDTLVIM